jgi:hypothetical protein
MKNQPTAIRRAWNREPPAERRMRERIVDLAVLFGFEGTLLARTGRAILDCAKLPHPILDLIEELYPDDVARARFRALWSQHAASTPDAAAIGFEFRNELIDVFRRRGNLVEPCTLVIHER